MIKVTTGSNWTTAAAVTSIVESLKVSNISPAPKLGQLHLSGAGYCKVDESKPFDPIAFFRQWPIDGKQMAGTHSTAIEYEGGLWGAYSTKGCMALLSIPGSWHSQGSHAKIKAIYSSLWHNKDLPVEDYAKYWKFIFNKKWSPWRCVLKDHEVYEVDGVPIGHVIRDVTAPWQTTVNLFMAGRMPYAQDGYLRMFTRMKEAGFTNTESLFITANARLTPQNMVAFPYAGDYCFDTTFADMSWKRWSEGNPAHDKSRSVNVTGNYSPCNAIWSHSNPGGYVSEYTRKPTVIQTLLSGKIEYKGAFGKAFSEYKPSTPMNGVSLDEAVSILREKKAEWRVN